jgi:hypothetical protein
MFDTSPKYILPVLMVLLFGCASQQISQHQEPCTPLTSEEFLERPFYVDLKIDSVQKVYGERLKLTRFLRKVDEGEHKNDTIYRFHNRHTSLVFYKTAAGDQSFLTSKIADESVELRHCIRVGISRIEMEERISDFPSNFRDTVTIENDKRQGVFVFDESKLKAVFINNFFK